MADTIGAIFIQKGLVAEVVILQSTFIGKLVIVETVEANGFFRE